MHLSKAAFPLLFGSVVLAAAPSTTFAQDNLAAEPQILQPSNPVFIPADPFLLSVTWQPNGGLAVSPEWLGAFDATYFKKMLVPATIRYTFHDGFQLGEFALEDGTWSPLFVVPSEVGTLPDAIDEGSLFPDKQNVKSDSYRPSSFTDTTEVKVMTEPLDALVEGEIDPAFPKNVSATWLQSIKDRGKIQGHRQFFVNNISGDNTSEGAMLHPQLGSARTKGPLRDLSTALSRIQDGDEVILVGTGHPYKWYSVAVKNVIITPIGDVTLEP